MTKNDQSAKEIVTNKKEKPVKSHGFSGFSVFVTVLIIITAAIAIHVYHLNQLNQKIEKLQAKTNQDTTLLSSRIDALQNVNRRLQESLQLEQENIDNVITDKFQHIEEKMQNKLVEYAANIKVTETAETNTSSDKSGAPEKIITIEKIKTPDELLIASGALVVRDMVENGQPIAYETEVLQILAQGNEIATRYVETIKEFANAGISGKNSLIRDFNRLYISNVKSPKAVQSGEQVSNAESTAEPNWQQKALDFVKSMILQKKQPKEEQNVLPPEGEEIYQLVNAGKFSQALQQIKISGIDNKSLQEWQKQVEDYLRFEQAVNGLIMNALAHIKLKEYDHDKSI